MANDVSELIYHPMRDHAGRFVRPGMFCHLTYFDIHERGNGYQISSLLRKPNTPCISITMTERPRRQRAEAIMQWAKARWGPRLLVLVVQQTFGGFLTFVPHLHVMVSVVGLHESKGRWIYRLKFDKEELMRAWRYALIDFLAEAHKRNVLRSNLSVEEIRNLFATQYQRLLNIFISRAASKAHRLRHDGRYIRRPPIAQHRMTRRGNHQVGYVAKDTRNKQFVNKCYTNEEFVSQASPSTFKRDFCEC